MKNILFCISLALSFATFGKELPNVPENCFSDKVYCSNWEVITDPELKKFIRINFFAELSGDFFKSYQDIENLYMNFPQWVSYAEGSNSIKISLSQQVDQGTGTDGQPYFSHQAHYLIRGPAPVNWVKVKEITTYQKIPEAVNAVSSWAFDLKKDNPELEGVKAKKGELHISFDQEKNVYLVFVVVDIYPSIAILHKMAAPYMESGFVSMFLGMFDLK
jgi:hypothetical protein